MTVDGRRLSRVVQELVLDREAVLAFRDGDVSGLTLDGLDDDERAALLAKDIPALYALGTHPIALFHLSAILHPRAHFVREVVPAIQGVPNPFYDYYRNRDQPGSGSDGHG